MRFLVQKWRDPKTARIVEADDATTAPDEYAAQHLERSGAGSVSFVEVLYQMGSPLSSKPVLWRVETLDVSRTSRRARIEHAVAFFTISVTEAQALAEFAERGQTPPEPS